MIFIGDMIFNSIFMSSTFRRFLTTCLVGVSLFIPWSTFAAPITGADLDVGRFWVNSFGSYTDDTTDANSVTADDVDWPVTGGSSLYFGSTSKFSKIYFYISAEGVSSPWDIPTAGNYGSLQYFDGTNWVDVTVTNNTGAWDGAGIHTLSLTPPSDWAATQVNSEGTDYYYLRINGCDMGCNQMLGNIDMDQISLLSVGGGGSAVPEFGGYLYGLILISGFFFLWKKLFIKTAF